MSLSNSFLRVETENIASVPAPRAAQQVAAKRGAVRHGYNDSVEPDPPPVLDYHTPTREPRDRARELRDLAVAVALFCWVPSITGVLQVLRDFPQRGLRGAPDGVEVLVVVSIPLGLFAAGVLFHTRRTAGPRRFRFLATS